MLSRLVRESTSIRLLPDVSEPSQEELSSSNLFDNTPQSPLEASPMSQSSRKSKSFTLSRPLIEFTPTATGSFSAPRNRMSKTFSGPSKKASSSLNKTQNVSVNLLKFDDSNIRLVVLLHF